MAKRDYYEILEVDKSSDDGTIKKSYRKIAMKYHPDRNPGDKAAEDNFKEAAEAYGVLSDPDKKARYDRYGHAGVDPNMGGGYGGNMNMDDILRNFGNIFEDSPFESFFGGGGRAESSGQRGSSLRISLTLDLNEIATGVNKKIAVKKQISCATCSGSGAKDRNSKKTCNTCGGSGYVRQIRNTFLGQMQTTTSCPQCQGAGTVITSFCQTCKGEGKVMGEETIDLDIPAGVEDGMQLSVRGKGNAGVKGGPPGDLIIQIKEKPHESLKRDGSNLVYDLYLNFADVSLGSAVEVPTLDGKASIKIPAGTQAGKVFRLKDKGLPSVQSYQKGDLLVQVNIWTPKHLNEEERALLEQLRVLPNFQPNPGKSEKGFFEKMKGFFS
ncbi:MAG: molecular chaperone DnaJ [Saprospiraceae bacterium]|jgi:molecular chaperone DnaJ|nr:molecular chaperone DnaJ [Saprospiraceae bacterium]MBK6814592.1 molecular chaperone DnaJ [Saprospiraceae bacterium]MBK7608807.1 molecular chaperone DnaJ [Saprospiraceae bacterium]MBK8279054.1 molecular chaperone DnaJ [Saprospiraceae bacterium]MBK8512266.1 molecular chaperone DnaJ [Saprospiraceae bacterium]